MINRRSVWILSAMAIGVLTLLILTVGSTAGQFGFGSSGSADSPAASDTLPRSYRVSDGYESHEYADADDESDEDEEDDHEEDEGEGEDD